jgi:putative transposase
MKRREVPYGVRFVTFSCFKRLPLLGSDSLRDVFANALAESRREHGFELFAWVAMPEHAHILMRPAPGEPLDRALLSLKLSVSRTILSRWRKLRAPVLPRLTLRDGSLRFWQSGGGFDRNVRNDVEFRKEVRYIHRNPVERELVTQPQGWKWSSVRWWMGVRENEVPCDARPGPTAGADTWKGFM